ncbi:MAG: hypothetical protein J5822_03995, partial [Eubacteriaceae bacterium]|nr:hypothetical protein [Eubacteriaceae bacterium]
MSQKDTVLTPPSAKTVYKKPSQAKEIWRRFKKTKGAVIGMVMLIIILVAVLIGPILIPYSE